MKRFTVFALAAALALGLGGAPAAFAAGSPRVALDRLGALENDAEGIAEGEVTGSAARAASRHAAQAWRLARTSLATNHVADAALPAVDAAVAAFGAERDPARLRRSANEVTGALAPLFPLAGDVLPADVHRLDYLGRSLALDARDANWDRAAIDRAALRRAWAALRPQILSRAGGAKAAVAYDRAAHALDAAVQAQDATRTGSAAASSGDAVDLLEKVYGA